MERAALAAFDQEAYISLATRRRDGRFVETPVWFAVDGDRIYVFSESKAGKMKRLRNFSEVRVAACNLRGKVHGPWIPGTGQRTDDPAAISRAYAALHRKYGWRMTVADFFSRLSGRIAQRAMIEIAV